MPAEFIRQRSFQDSVNDFQAAIQAALMALTGAESGIRFVKAMKEEKLGEALKSAGEFGLNNIDLPIGGLLAMLVGQRARNWNDLRKVSSLYDRIPRAEISDAGMRLKAKPGELPKVGRLDEFIEHEELFNAYPYLRGREIRYDEMPAGFQGYRTNPFEPPHIGVNKIFIQEEDELLDTLTHEIQHDVQSFEGWPSGGGTAEHQVVYETRNKMASKWEEQKKRLEKALPKLREAYQDAIEDYGEEGFFAKADAYSNAKGEIERLRAVLGNVDEYNTLIKDVDMEKLIKLRTRLEDSSQRVKYARELKREALKAKEQQLTDELAKTMAEFGRGRIKNLDEHIKKLNDLSAERNSVWDALNKLWDRPKVEKKKAELANFTDKMKDRFSDLYYAIYNALSGESMARDAAKRRKLTDAERVGTPLFQGEPGPAESINVYW